MSASEVDDQSEADIARDGRDRDDESEADTDSQARDEEPWRGSVGATRSRDMLANSLKTSQISPGLGATEAAGKSKGIGQPRESHRPPAESLRRRTVLPWSRKPSENWEIVDLTTPSLVESPSELSPPRLARNSRLPGPHTAQTLGSPSSSKISSSRLPNIRTAASADWASSRRPGQDEDELASEDHASSTSEPSSVQRRRMALVDGLDQPFFSVGPNDRKSVNLSMDSSDWSGVQGLAISGSGAEGWNAEKGAVRSDEEGGNEDRREESSRYVRQLSKVSEEIMSEGSRDEGDEADFISVSEYTEDGEGEVDHQGHDHSFGLETDGEGAAITFHNLYTQTGQNDDAKAKGTGVKMLSPGDFDVLEKTWKRDQHQLHTYWGIVDRCICLVSEFRQGCVTASR